MIYGEHPFRARKTNLVRCRVTSDRAEAFAGTPQLPPYLLGHFEGHGADAVCEVEGLVVGSDGDVFSRDDLFDIGGHGCVCSCERLGYACCIACRTERELRIELEVVEIAKAFDNVAGGNPSVSNSERFAKPAVRNVSVDLTQDGRDNTYHTECSFKADCE